MYSYTYTMYAYTYTQTHMYIGTDTDKYTNWYIDKAKYIIYKDLFSSVNQNMKHSGQTEEMYRPKEGWWGTTFTDENNST